MKPGKAALQQENWIKISSEHLKNQGKQNSCENIMRKYQHVENPEVMTSMSCHKQIEAALEGSLVDF